MVAAALSLSLAHRKLQSLFNHNIDLQHNGKIYRP